VPNSTTRARVAPIFGLTLLETLRDQDRPSEVLEDEVPSATMPRRLGLSEVIEKQIGIYRTAVRQRTKMTDAQVADLVKLVVRRPDATEVFWKAGVSLALRYHGGSRMGVARFLPRGVAFYLTRRAAARGLNKLFGRRMGGYAQGPFALEGRGLPFVEADPSGCACHFVSGFCQTIVARRMGREYQVVHSKCQARQDDLCRWTVTGEARQRERDGVREMLLRPELESG
jgi:hypothetical protein